MSIFSKKKPAKPGDSFLDAVNKAYKKSLSRMEAKEARQRKIDDCAIVLNDCRFTFNQIISVENSLAAEMRRKGLPNNKQYARVRDCAVGILIVDQALYELKSIHTEDDLNGAMNKMGMALRQMRRIDNSSAAVSNSTEKIIRQWYPDGLFTNREEEPEGPVLPEVSEELSNIIDENFIQNMMDGHSFERCMKMRQQAPKSDPTRNERAKLMEEVREAAGVPEKKHVDVAAIGEMYKNKF